ncbi:MAG: hypothetical protein J0653_00705, partial [Deltaproteobacteria bacterium]|nr:hypothetical protein [Deltaproteobacteria bacterium]
MKPANISLLCSAIALCFSSAVSAGQSLDQSYTPYSIPPTISVMAATVPYLQSDILGQAKRIPWLAQTFEVGMSGQFTAVDLLLGTNSNAHESYFGPITISLHSIAGGIPSTQWAATT